MATAENGDTNMRARKEVREMLHKVWKFARSYPRLSVIWIGGSIYFLVVFMAVGIRSATLMLIAGIIVVISLVVVCFVSIVTGK